MPYIACDRGLNLPLAVTARTPVLLRPPAKSEVTISRLGGAKYLRVTLLGPHEGATDALANGGSCSDSQRLSATAARLSRLE